MSTDKITAYVGSYASGDAVGIHICRLEASGELIVEGGASGVRNPSFLAIHPNRPFLYSVSEVGGDPGGGVAAFAIDTDSGALRLLNQQSSCGKGPCHVSVDATGRCVLTANYGSGSVAMLPIDEDGSVKGASHSVQHEGSSVHPERQQGPHAHSITVDPGNRFAYAADLGLDRVLIYEMDLDAGKLKPAGSAKVQDGAGPRHFAFHPKAARAYVINELDSTIVGFRVDAASGALKAFQTISTLPDGYDDTSTTADIHLSACGRFLYGSNRGHDSVAIFSVDGEGVLSSVGRESTRGECPRNFAIDPSGRILLAANQNTDNIVSYRIDPDSGMLTPTGHVLEVPKPVCIKFHGG